MLNSVTWVKGSFRGSFRTVLFTGFHIVDNFMDGSGDDNFTTSTESSNVTTTASQGKYHFYRRRGKNKHKTQVNCNNGSVLRWAPSQFGRRKWWPFFSVSGWPRILLHPKIHVLSQRRFSWLLFLHHIIHTNKRCSLSPQKKFEKINYYFLVFRSVSRWLLWTGLCVQMLLQRSWWHLWSSVRKLFLWMSHWMVWTWMHGR